MDIRFPKQDPPNSLCITAVRCKIEILKLCMAWDALSCHTYACLCAYAHTHTRKPFAWVHACPLCARTWTCKCVWLCVYCMPMSVCVSVQSACPQRAHSVTDCPTGFINQLLLGATWKHSSTCVQQTELRSVVALLGYSGSNNLSVCLHTQQKEVFISKLYFSHVWHIHLPL